MAVSGIVGGGVDAQQWHVCGRKRAYWKPTAHKARRQMGVKYDGEFDVYRCPYSLPGHTHWHVGHLPRWVREQRQLVEAK